MTRFILIIFLLISFIKVTSETTKTVILKVQTPDLVRIQYTFFENTIYGEYVGDIYFTPEEYATTTTEQKNIMKQSLVQYWKTVRAKPYVYDPIYEMKRKSGYLMEVYDRIIIEADTTADTSLMVELKQKLEQRTTEIQNKIDNRIR